MVWRELWFTPLGWLLLFCIGGAGILTLDQHGWSWMDSDCLGFARSICVFRISCAIVSFSALESLSQTESA